MLSPTVQVPDLAKVIDGQLGNIADIASTSMREAALKVKQDWRDEIIGSGLGVRLGNTIRANTYPKRGGALNPAAYIFTRAPKIIDAFARGATIRPVAGGRYLWIPTRNVPRRMYRGARRMSPDEVEAYFHARFFFEKGDNGGLLAFIDAVAAKSAKRPGYRRATAGRMAQGRKAEPVLMFTLVRTVRMPKKIDLQGIADAGAAEFVRSMTLRLGR